MGCGGSTAKDSGGTQPEKPPAKAAAKPAPGAKPAAAGGSDPEYENMHKTFGGMFSTAATVGKEKNCFAAVSANESKGLDVSVASATSGDVWCATFTEAELGAKKDAAKTIASWPAFFKQLKTGLRKASSKDAGETVTLSIPEEKKGPALTFALKMKKQNPEAMHQHLMGPLCAHFAKTKTGDDSKSSKTEVEANQKRASMNEFEQKVSALKTEIEPLSKAAKQAQEDARAAKEQCDGVRKRIHKLKNVGKKDRDHLYPDGPAIYQLHTTHSKEYIPTLVSPNINAMHLIKEMYGGDTSVAPPSVEGVAHGEVMTVLAKIDDWDYDVFALEAATNKGALFMTCYALLYKYQLVKHFNIDETVLVNFLQAVESGYHPNPYHNSTHAADVLQITHYIMEPGGLKQTINMTQNDCLAALLSAAIHDYDHPGFNNNFHIRTSAYLAILYNDRSVLENHHLEQVFDLVKNPKYNVFAGMTWEQFKDIRDTMLEMVLSTDMGMHAKIYQTFRRRMNEDKEWAGREDQRLAMSIAIKMADISNCCRPAALYKVWAKNIAAEFYNQGDAEARLGFTISPFMDRRKDKADFPKGQISFMNYIVIPLFDAGSSLLPKMKFSLEEAQKNKQDWLSGAQ